MKKLLLFVLLFLPTGVTAQAPDPLLAVVRLRSHGASGTVIATGPGRTWILSCAHAFETQADRNKPIRIDGPPQPNAPAVTARVRLVAVDPRLDLSLIELSNGPFWCCPVAPAGYRPSGQLASAGYDNMQWPLTRRAASVLSFTGGITFTREKPWHGRSGGGLIDVQGRVLVGVCQGYEVGGQARGMYVSHSAILAFLGKRMASGGGAQPPQPEYAVPYTTPPRATQPGRVDRYYSPLGTPRGNPHGTPWGTPCQPGFS